VVCWLKGVSGIAARERVARRERQRKRIERDNIKRER